MPISRVLLVHGAWHGAWCWDRVLELLRSSGYRPEAMDLPGHGDSPEPLGDLHRDADAVAPRLDMIGEPTLLVGHSYGGMVITDAGSHEAVAALVGIQADDVRRVHRGPHHPGMAPTADGMERQSRGRFDGESLAISLHA